MILIIKQKKAYEMLISDWSSDVCSSDLLVAMSVIDNLAIAATRDRNWWACFSRKGEAEARSRAEEILEQIGPTDRRDTLAGNLSHGAKQWLEIGMVVATDAALLLLDAPTADRKSTSLKSSH